MTNCETERERIMVGEETIAISNKISKKLADERQKIKGLRRISYVWRNAAKRGGSCLSIKVLPLWQAANRLDPPKK